MDQLRINWPVLVCVNDKCRNTKCKTNLLARILQLARANVTNSLQAPHFSTSVFCIFLQFSEKVYMVHRLTILYDKIDENQKSRSQKMGNRMGGNEFLTKLY